MRPLLVAAAAAAALLAAAPREAAPPPTAAAPAMRCGSCHEFQYGTWRRGPHALSATRETFRAAYRLASRDLGEERASEVCLSCHAPLARLTGDRALETPVVREGVTCDVCHSVRGVGRIGAPAPFDLEVGRTKFGPYGDGRPVDHDVGRSEVTGSSRLCAGCHQADLAAGLVAYNTFAEAQSGRWSGSRCADCHMPGREGRIAAGGPVRPLRRDHQMDATSPAWWARGLRLEVSVERGDPVDRVVARIENAAGGHAAPTGHPDERLEVVVIARDAAGRPLVEASRSFGLVLADSAGVAPVPFWRAAVQRDDTRLRPDETRVLSWAVPRDRAATAEARLLYHRFAPEIAALYRVEVEPEEVLAARWAPVATGLRDLPQ